MLRSDNCSSCYLFLLIIMEIYRKHRSAIKFTLKKPSVKILQKISGTESFVPHALTAE